ncbi:hypothetical protein BVC93_04585 [Mycobacterium sp. MS1601]|uniref:hypothetical protein n=1 Tax=Mycobacterium sp. MS1601 TaxID=1936029 RepID=UPI0009792D6F|nr:hypothetical protein [Mycobacterium sp. MS1601]AQA01836.1 hypothetical protein BVC93_04585 [Mycobacterium sp. MS1601]
MEPVLGPESLAAGALTRGALRWNYSRVQPRVHRPKEVAATLAVRTLEAWLWSDRRAIIAGQAAAALHGAKWVTSTAPVELITEHTRKRAGIVVREERIADDEICQVGDFRVTSPARTALDLARFAERNNAVARVDALAAATGVTAQDALDIAGRYRRLRHVGRARTALDLMDAGAQSPQETWLRLVLVDAGFPRPRTQIPLSHGGRCAYLDMGWEEPQIALDYEGDHHRQQRPTYVRDIGRYDMIERLGWLDLRVVREHSRAFIIHRVREAAARRRWKF